MFTGLIDDVGTIEEVESSRAGRTFRVRSAYEDLAVGESVAVNGVCLTVRECGPQWFRAAAVATTLDRTTLGQWERGRRVNLERALRLGDRVGGHIVQGHVNGLAHVRQVGPQRDSWLVDLVVPGELTNVIIPHGSITIDGVSLTVNDQAAPDAVQVSIIDYTLRHTTLGSLRPGDDVHVEGDVIGKYVRRLVAPHLSLAR